MIAPVWVVATYTIIEFGRKKAAGVARKRVPICFFFPDEGYFQSSSTVNNVSLSTAS
ncbi:MAG: hypothetical protein HQL52_05590 [Magnetococcales bacterium]|nr:hypothetical protein [Magnetococcales bacterium]